MNNYKSLSLEEFNKLTNKKEDSYFDYKSARISPIDLQKDIVSFANGEGGSILVGYDEVKGIDGFENIDSYDNIIGACYDVSPVIPDLKNKFLEYEGHYLLLIIITKSQRVHETSRSEVYLRDGARKIKLNQDQITSLKYKKGELRFEDQTMNIDIEAVSESNYLSEYLSKFKINDSSDKYLMRNGLIYDNKPKISAIIFFHDEPQIILKCGIKINVFGMQKTSRTYMYDRKRRVETFDFTGPIEKIINSSLDCIFKSVMSRGVNYPKEAIQEGLVNAIIHRDFSVQEDIIVNLYDNSIEIISPGGFPGNLKSEDFNIKNIKRYLRNKTISTLLFKVSSLEIDINERISQDQGEGVKTIFSSMKKAGLKEPVYKEEYSHVHLVLKHENAESYEKRILEYIKSNGSIANREARDLLGEEDKEVIKNVFNKLKSKGIIKYEDDDVTKNKVRYKLVNKDEDTEVNKVELERSEKKVFKSDENLQQRSLFE